MKANQGLRYLGFVFLVLSVWATILIAQADRYELIGSYSHFFMLGLVGAIVANSTGSGGGIVFIPFFTALGLTPDESVGTSILIQCFGMTVGSVAWLHSMHREKHELDTRLQLVKRILVVAGLSTIVGVLIGQHLLSEPPFSLTVVFRAFSIIFGAILLFLSLRSSGDHHVRHLLNNLDMTLLVIVCVLGGIITAWISVGVGEWVALLLLFRCFPTMIAISVGVCMSAVAVLTAAYHHIAVLQSVSWEILLFAAPAAMIGGSVARFLAVRLGPARLKIFLAVWILITGLVMQEP